MILTKMLSATEVSFEQRRKDWKYIKKNTKSLLSAEPSQSSTPNVWILDGKSPHVEDDDKFINQHFPGHKVIKMSDTIQLH
jgi:hypothetical protein